MPINVIKKTAAAGGCQSCDSLGDVLVIRITAHPTANTAVEFRLCAAKCGPELIAAMNREKRNRRQPRTKEIVASPEMTNALRTLLCLED